jgi:hypothetical protein
MYFEVDSIIEVDALREEWAIVNYTYDKVRGIYCVTVY